MDRSYAACTLAACKASHARELAACICQPQASERMTSSYNRLTIKRFPRVQERETAEARYWRNFTNPEVQVSGRVVQFLVRFFARCCLDHPTLPAPSSQLCVPSPRAYATCLEVRSWRGIRCSCAYVLARFGSRRGRGRAGLALACINSTLVLAFLSPSL